MFTNGLVKMYHTQVEPLSTGERIFNNDDHIVDINELHKTLCVGVDLVIIANDVSLWSDATEIQYYVMTDRLSAEVGYEHTFVFSHYGRSGVGATNRKLMLSFSEVKDNPVMKASYFNS